MRLKAYGDYYDQYSQMLEGEVGLRTAKLVESEARFAPCSPNAIRQVFFLTDPRMTQMFYVSPGYKDVYGRSCDSLYANPRSWREAAHPEDRESTFARIAPAGTIVPFDIEYRILLPDGAERFIWARGFPIATRPATSIASPASPRTSPSAGGRPRTCGWRRTPPRPRTGPRASSWRT